MHRNWDWPVWAMIGGCALVVVAVGWWAIFGTTLPDPLFGTELQCLVSWTGKCAAAKAAASAAGVWFPYEPIAFWLGLAILLVGVIARPLAFVAAVDTLNEKIGVVCNWLVLLACIVSGGNAMIRYAYDQSSNAWLEVQWYMAPLAGRTLARGIPFEKPTSVVARQKKTPPERGFPRFYSAI